MLDEVLEVVLLGEVLEEVLLDEVLEKTQKVMEVTMKVVAELELDLKK